MITLMSGSGNTFCVIDNRDGSEKDISSKAIDLCKRWKTDGALFVENSSVCDVRMRIINPDGSEAQMCGNGARCFGRFVFDKGIVKKKDMVVETKAGPITLTVGEEKVKAGLTQPKDFKELKMDIKEYKGNVYFVNTGVPHAVIIVDDVEKEDVYNKGRAIRYAKEFLPEGTNVDFVQYLKDSFIKVRTYERGVENETGACGTGATASAIISFMKMNVLPPVSVITRSLEILVVDFILDKDVIKNVSLEGKVSYL